MKLSAFKAYVDRHADLFQGKHRETPETIAAAEAQLGVTLPETMRWLLCDYGYSGPSGMEPLSDVIRVTREFRINLGLPREYIILNSWGEAGVVFMNTADGTVYWGDEGDAGELVDSEEPPDSSDMFKDYPAWVADRVQFELEQRD